MSIKNQSFSYSNRWKIKASVECECGNVLFIILIAVALFAALSLAVTQSSRGGGAGIEKEKQKLEQAVIDNYMACINQGRMTLEIVRKCKTINYDPPALWSGTDFECHIFHPKGAGCAYQDLGLNECDLQGIKLSDLAIGEACGNIVRAGTSGGSAIYTTKTDQGSMPYSSGGAQAGALSDSDGLANTNSLIASGLTVEAAQSCRALGPEWYLPAINELAELMSHRNSGELSGTINNSVHYMSSTDNHPKAKAFRLPHAIISTCWKNSNCQVRCIRRD